MPIRPTATVFSLNQFFSIFLNICTCLRTINCVKSVQIRSSFWSLFSRIRTEYGDLPRKSPYSVRIWENTDQKKLRIWILFMPWLLQKVAESYFWGEFLFPRSYGKIGQNQNKQNFSQYLLIRFYYLHT